LWLITVGTRFGLELRIAFTQLNSRLRTCLNRYAITPLGPGLGGDGNHTITGSTPFGISVYGYGTDTSFWYPGGLDLRLIPID
jgi:hypothetical protein